MIFFHGGGWTNGYKEWCGFMAPALAAHGVALAAPTYRLAPGVRYPTFLEDALDAIAAIAAQARTYGGNPRRPVSCRTFRRRPMWRLWQACDQISGPAWHRPGYNQRLVFRSVAFSTCITRIRRRAVWKSGSTAMFWPIGRTTMMASPLNWLSPLRLPLFLSWGTKGHRTRAAQQHGRHGRRQRCRASLLVSQLRSGPLRHPSYAA